MSRRPPSTLQLAAVVAATVVVLQIAGSRVVSRMADFEVYWTAAVRARGAEPLYRAEDGHYQFKYLPAFAVLTAPAGLVPLPAAKGMWFHASVVLLLTLIALSIGALPDRRKPEWLLAVVVVIAMGKFYGHELVLGQVNLLFAVIALLAIHAMSLERERTAGVLLSLAVVVKPYAVIFGPWLAARRRVTAIAAFVAGLVASVALPMGLYGVRDTIALHADWWRTVTDSTAPNLTNADNVSIAGMYAKWLGGNALVQPLVMITGLALLAAAALVFIRRGGVPRPHVLEGALLLTLVPLLSPQGWDYVFLVATPAIVIIANYEACLPRTIRIAAAAAVLVAGLSLYDVMGRALYARFMALSIVTVCYLIVVAALVTLRLRHVA